MRKILLPLLGLFVLFSQSNFAQSELDTVLVKAASTEEPSLDDKINSAIQPVTSQVEKIIFYSFKLKEEIQYKKLDDTSYTKEPPFLIEYDGSVPFGSAFTITEAGADQYKIEYGHTDDDGNEYSVSGTFGYGEKVDLGEFSITTTSTGKAFDGTYTFTVNSIGLPFVLIWLILGAVIFTLYFKFFNVTGFKLAIDVVRGKYTDPKEKGEVSHFQALTTALSGTVGLGNIAGVAVAIAIGGPGATFWMILAGILGMSSKFVECTLGVTYRNVDADGKVHGGPMYYLSNCLLYTSPSPRDA